MLRTSPSVDAQVTEASLGASSSVERSADWLGICVRAMKTHAEGSIPQRDRTLQMTCRGSPDSSRTEPRPGAMMPPRLIITWLIPRTCSGVKGMPASRKRLPVFLSLPSVIEMGYSPPTPRPSKKRHKASWCARQNDSASTQQAASAQPSVESADVARAAVLWLKRSASSPKRGMPVSIPANIRLAIMPFFWGVTASGCSSPRMAMIKSITARS
mmetsp:Transcript_34637/g.99533  ORF Transcript_34637/g.99533 Transcript_34637/m.99533 type:complete len:214 (-) Transcript_34637:172-813(-)